MTQQVPYEVLKKIEDIEIRQYPEVIFAVVEDNNNDSGFGLLFQYISGENKTRRKIAMTAPVITSEKISMTAPCQHRKKLHGLCSSLVIYQGDCPDTNQFLG